MTAGTAAKWICVVFLAGFALLVLVGVASSVWDAWAGGHQ